MDRNRLRMWYRKIKKNGLFPQSIQLQVEVSSVLVNYTRARGYILYIIIKDAYIDQEHI